MVLTIKYKMSPNAEPPLSEITEEVETYLPKLALSMQSPGRRVRMTISDTEMIHHANDHNPERRSTYLVLGGNSSFAIVEYKQEGNHSPRIGYIYIDGDVISTAQPEFDSFPEQCDMARKEFLSKVYSATSGSAEGVTALAVMEDEPLSEEQLEEIFQRSFKERVFFRRVSK